MVAATVVAMAVWVATWVVAMAVWVAVWVVVWVVVWVASINSATPVVGETTKEETIAVMVAGKEPYTQPHWKLTLGVLLGAVAVKQPPVPHVTHLSLLYIYINFSSNFSYFQDIWCLEIILKYYLLARCTAKLLYSVDINDNFRYYSKIMCPNLIRFSYFNAIRLSC